MQLSNAVQGVRVSNAVAAGQTTITPGSGVDHSNAEGVLYQIAFGAITAGAVVTIKLQQSDDNGVTDDFSDVQGSLITVPDTASNKVFYLDGYKATKKFTKPIISRATQNAALDSIVALRYGLRNQPSVAHSTEGGRLALSGAIEGTP